MKNPLRKDIILVIILTIISIIFIILYPLTKYPFNLVSYIPLILFLPGYVFIATKYPQKNDLGLLKRIIGSIMISALLTLLLLLITNIKILGINLTSIILLIGIFTILLSFNALKKDTTINEDDVKTIDKINKPAFVSKDLLLIFLTTILAIIFIVTPKLNETFIRSILGLFLILFIPGYSLIAAFFPKKGDLDGIERAALSFGLSIAVTPLICLALNYTPWEIKLTHIIISLSAFTIIMVIIAYLRRSRVPDDEKFYVNFVGFLSSFKSIFKGESKTSKILLIILISSIILAIGTTAYIIVKPKQGETFTEFYLLGPGGKASDYPANLTVGQNTSVIIGIVNHEYQTVNYQLVVISNGTVMDQQNIILTNGNQTQIPYNFTATSAGTKKMEFLLYKLPDTTNVYKSLHLFVNMT